ncbi:MAG: hypothetical protein RL238_3730 [Actinomycetota bacterium]|jgi:hypothetical protein
MLEAARPQVRPLDTVERTAMRARLFGDTPSQASTLDTDEVAGELLALKPVTTHSATPRRWFAVAAALVLICAAIAATMFIRHRGNEPDQQPTATTVAVAGSLPSELEPSPAYWAAVWPAREIVIGKCMATFGYEYKPRPFGSNSTTTQAEWDAWFNEQVAADPAFERTLLGAPDQQSGGCQLEAFHTVHGPGEEAYSKMANLLNQMLGDLPTDSDRSDENIAAWIDDHRTQVDEVNAELAQEQATAQSIINSSTG